jgi:hypothetical protein
LLLIKGVSHKEIATVCAVSERTVREQARSIYSKAGLTGRAMSARTPCLPLTAHFKAPQFAAPRFGADPAPGQHLEASEIEDVQRAP